jgi:hypothetical protein
MFPEPLFWLLLVLKMAVTAGFVVVATVLAERAGPVVGALVATLPVSAGPAYVFIALQHDAAFVAQGALMSFAVNIAAAIFALIYAMRAQQHGLAASLLPAMAVWLLLVLAINAVRWTTLAAIALNFTGLAICIPLANRFRHAKVPLVPRRWTDLLMRAAMVAVLVAAVVTASEVVGPNLTGILAVFPIVLTSLILILHPRIGGPATAAVLSNTMPGLAGFSLCCLTAHLMVGRIGVAAGLCAALAVSIGLNFSLWAIRRRSLLAAASRS